MIDMHCHLLPGVDDGPKDWDESLALVRQGAEDGIKAALVTPHLGELNPGYAEVVKEKFSELVGRVREEGIDMRLILGAEVAFDLGLERLKEFGLGTFGGRYFLLELLPLGFVSPSLEEVLFNLHLEGLRPVLAHIERYPGLVDDTKRLEKLVRTGALLQVNAEAFLRKQAKTVLKLVRMGLVHIVGSDAHDPRSRPMRMAEAYGVVKEKLGARMAERIFEETPEALLSGEEVDLEPMAKEERSIFGRIVQRLRGT
ncbi:MAG: hypothetical protein DRQ08_00210 [Candidatus Latescibacterota bacterium]|nr:MAG: hypothetical protein DRQ08_00210 [Candidatus Latescibacterota bacterium]